MSKTKRKKHLIGKKEFFFNFLSLLILLSVALYFGGRSFYYYSKQNMTLKVEAQTLNGLVTTSNKITSSGDGLYRDKDGYYFKGNISNNYVSFGNRLFRIISINNKKEVKVVSDDLVASFMWGEESNYKNSNVRNWLNDTGIKNTGVYYNTIPNPEKFLVKTKYSEDTMSDDKVKKNKEEISEYVTTLGISDYVLANGKSSYLNNQKIYYLLGLNSDKNNLYVEEDGSIQEADSLDGYGIRAVITFKRNLNVKSGDGTKNNPYVINQGKDVNYVDSFVKLGNDYYKVTQDKNNILKMYKCRYATYNGIYVVTKYSEDTSLFDLTDYNNIAYFLNTKYLYSLPYAKYLVNNYYFTGEMSSETGYNFLNIYNNYVTCKVGLLNIFDYVPYDYLNDYFHMNTTSSVGGIQYSTYSNGLLEEVDVTEEKHVVPVISINKNIIKKGLGTLNNPYLVE